MDTLGSNDTQLGSIESHPAPAAAVRKSMSIEIQQHAVPSEPRCKHQPARARSVGPRAPGTDATPVACLAVARDGRVDPRAIAAVTCWLLWVLVTAATALGEDTVGEDTVGKDTVGEDTERPDAQQTQDAQQPQRTPNQVSDAEIQAWIEKLGSDSYATRVRARNQLKRFGLRAFDALREALNHTDSEILSAARYLISSLQVNWHQETDPKEVREILFEYGAQSQSERLARIQLLSRLPEQMGVGALARLARFDPVIELSRRAAMLVLEQPMPDDPDEREAMAERIESVLGDNDRHASQWLAAYAKDLRAGDYGAQRWNELVQQQREIVNTGSSKNATSESVIELIRVLASRAIEEGEKDEALALVDQHIDLVPPKTSELDEHCEWATRHGLFPIVVALYQNNLHLFEENADLLYSAAHAYGQIGNDDRASTLAKQALRVEPFPAVAKTERSDQDEGRRGDPIPDRRLQEIGYSHFSVARLLRRRGRYEWAERELQYVIDHCDIELSVGVVARQELALMYSEQLKHGNATEVLQPIVQRLAKDRLYQARIGNSISSVNQIRSLYEYEQALQTLASVDGEPHEALSPAQLDRVKTKMQLAYRYDSQNIDILIRMYHLDDPNDSDWKPTIQKQIAQNRRKLEKSIATAEARVEENVVEEWKDMLAELLNQYAWLVANTEGDYQRALDASKRSLSVGLNDDPLSRSARLDTLARCYFAIGNVEQAIETQRQALELMPHSPPMRRQLKEFKAKL